MVDLDAIQARYGAAYEAAACGDLTLAADLAQFAVPALAAELRAAREAHAKLVEFHDSYDSGSDDRFKVRGRIFRILDDWDRAVK